MTKQIQMKNNKKYIRMLALKLRKSIIDHKNRSKDLLKTTGVDEKAQIIINRIEQRKKNEKN